MNAHIEVVHNDWHANLIALFAVFHGARTHIENDSGNEECKPSALVMIRLLMIDIELRTLTTVAQANAVGISMHDLS